MTAVEVLVGARLDDTTHAVTSLLVWDIKRVLPILLTLLVFVHAVIFVLVASGLHVFIHRTLINKSKTLEVGLHSWGQRCRCCNTGC